MKQSLASTLIALCILSLSACNYCEALEPDSSALSENTGDRALGLERGLAKGLNVVVIVVDQSLAEMRPQESRPASHQYSLNPRHDLTVRDLQC